MAESETHKHVKVIRLCPEPAIVEHPKKTPWSVRELKTGRPVQWQAMIRPPADVDSALWFFESRQVALAFVEQHEWATEYNWDVLREPQGDGSESSAPVQKRSHDSLTFFSRDGGVGDEYKVPAAPAVGVEDWAAQLPVDALVPKWMPKSYRSSGQSDIEGHGDLEASGSQVACVLGDYEDEVPFLNIHSASTYN